MKAVPTAGEHGEKLVLAHGRVLHLVDEEMLQPKPGLPEVRRQVAIRMEQIACGERQRGEIAYAFRGKQDLELNQGPTEYMKNGF